MIYYTLLALVIEYGFVGMLALISGAFVLPVALGYTIADRKFVERYEAAIAARTEA